MGTSTVPGRAMSCTLGCFLRSNLRCGGRSYSQPPLPFLRAMADCITIDSLTTAVDWFVSFTLHKLITCSYNCVIEKGFSEGEKRNFPILTVGVKYRKGTILNIKLVKPEMFVFLFFKSSQTLTAREERTGLISPN